jgi:hypothetical protein
LMELTDFLDGKLGRAVQFAMETIVSAATIANALFLFDIRFLHLYLK